MKLPLRFNDFVLDYIFRIPQDTVARLRDAQDKEIVMLENIGELKSRSATN